MFHLHPAHVRAAVAPRAAAFASLLALLGCAGTGTEPIEPVLVGDSVEALEAAVPDSTLALYRDDAYRLALRELARRAPLEQQAVEIPAEPTRGLYHALLAVYHAERIPARDSVVDLFRIHTFPSPTTRSLIVGLGEGAGWSQAWRAGERFTGNSRVDELLRRYRLHPERFYDWSIGPAAVLRAETPLNVAALARAFASIPGVRYAEPNGVGGDGNDITAEATDAGWRLTYSVGGGDCPAGCTLRHYWSFAVSRQGEVRYLGSRGDPLEPPGIRQ